ncbi:MAG: hypothetical protein AMXMBFR84_06190 [Candidatus Hydrogenedentota bacterium]
MKLAVALSILFMAFVAVAFDASAHEELERYIQQRVMAEVSRENIDFTLEILFTSPASVRERKRIDANHDGALDKAERKAYLESALTKLESDVRFQIDMEAVNIVPLGEPELDLLDSKDMEAHPHVLRFRFFARTPGSFRGGSVLQLDSRLFVDEPCLVSVSVQGKGGIQMSVSPTEGLKRAAEDEEGICLLKATCRYIRLTKSTSGEEP